jgi:hypothetical protein
MRVRFGSRISLLNAAVADAPNLRSRWSNERPVALEGGGHDRVLARVAATGTKPNDSY